MLSVSSLAPERHESVVDVLTDAFSDYPVMRVVVGAEGDVDARVRRLVRLFVDRRHCWGDPIFGVTTGGGLVGAAIVSRPTVAEPPSDVAAISEAAWRELGGAAQARYQAYADATSSFFADKGPHHHLNMIGVRTSCAGTGVARHLMTTIVELMQASPTSPGVSLTTERAKNLGFYEHFGFRVVAHQHVSEGLDTWGLWRDRIG